MEINNRILKAYLKNVYFINGTAYAGKSTIAKMISERLGLYHCKENYAFEKFLSISTIEEQPNMNYFKTMSGWDEFVTRTPEAYVDWINGVSKETTPFEIIELISIAKDKQVIVDTNIPIDVLKKITDEDHVAILLTDTLQSVDAFFDRDDEDKNFILKKIKETKNPEKTIQNYRKVLEMLNGPSVINAYENSGFRCFYRTKEKTLEDRYNQIIKHFGLDG